jgi:adenylosuccinate synthase
LREVLRGSARHGSCGLGVGETVEDSLHWPQEAVRAGDLAHPERLRPKLLAIQRRKWEQFAAHRSRLRKDPFGAGELAVLESAEVWQRWIEQAGVLASRVRIAPDALPDSGSLVLEGAQGVLLDEWRGFHPHTTWSTCTFDNALDLLSEWSDKVVKVGVIRSYATRHGAGPFPSQDRRLALPEPHNALGPWQGGFRLGWLDTSLLRYALDCCGGVDGLALTHLDRIRDGWRVASGYDGLDGEFAAGSRLRLGPARDLGYQQRLGLALQAATPRYEQLSRAAFVGRIEELLQTPVALESWGPCPQDKRIGRSLSPA